MRFNIPAWLVSLALHGVILVVLSLVTWAVGRSIETRVDVYLLPDDVSQGLLQAAGAPGSGGDLRPQQHEAGRGESDALAMRIPSPAPLVPAPPPLEPVIPSNSSAPAPPASQDPAMAMIGTILEPDSLDDSNDSTSSTPASRGGTGGELVGPGGAGRGQAIDILFVIDATRSMTPWFDRVQDRSLRTMNLVSGMLESLGRVRSARFGAIAFKDYGDEYGPNAVRGQVLTDDPEIIRQFIGEIQSGGGADESEPIDRALAAATAGEVGWSRTRRAMIVLFTDAPTHSLGRQAALDHIHQWTRRIGEAQIIVIDTGGNVTDEPPREQVRADLKALAQAGSGAAFLIDEQDAYWRMLIVSLFGPRYEPNVNALVEKFAGSKKESP